MCFVRQICVGMCWGIWWSKDCWLWIIYTVRPANKIFANSFVNNLLKCKCARVLCRWQIESYHSVCDSAFSGSRVGVQFMWRGMDKTELLIVNKLKYICRYVGSKVLLITVIVMLWPSLVHSFIRYILMSNYIVRNCSIPTIISIGPWLPIPRNNNNNINNRFFIVLQIQQQTNWCNLNLIAQHSVLYYNPSHGVTPCGWLTEPPTQSIMKKHE